MAVRTTIGVVPFTIKGRYRVVETIETTAEAVFYAAEDAEHDRRVTLAVLHGAAAADAEFQAAVRQQAHRLAKPEIAHPALVRVYGCDTTDEGTLFVVLEPVAGRTLREILDDRSVHDLSSALRLVIQVGEPFEALHPHGVVHGELRPETVLVLRDPAGTDTVKVTGVEFASARRTPVGLRLRDASVTPYLAPEQIEGGETTEAADVHALGLLAHELVTGQRPSATGPRTAAVTDLPAAIARIVAKALERAPARRYASVGLMLNDLWSAESNTPQTAGVQTAVTSGLIERRSATSRRARSDLGMAAALVLGLLLVGATAWVVTSDWIGTELRTGAPERPVTGRPVTASPIPPPAPVPSVNAVAVEPEGPSAASPAAAPAARDVVVPAAPAVEVKDRERPVARIAPVPAPRRETPAPAAPSADNADGAAIIDWLLKERR